jgi:4-amino-4-deoxy-L-arabinose transferase-like glycosyltransferase
MWPSLTKESLMTVIGMRRFKLTAGNRPAMSPRAWWVALGVILAISAFLRFYNLASSPGWEWDEPVYNSIGTSLAHGTGLRSTPEFGGTNGHYLYHPPFYFLLLGGWYQVFGSGITQARYLGATASLFYIALFALGTRRLVNPLAGLFTAALLTVDGWLLFENRISWLENSLMVLVALTVLAWERALRRQETISWLLLGLSLGATVIYKHVAIGVLVGSVIVFALMYRHLERPVRSILITFGVAALIVAVYIMIMVGLFPGEFLRQNQGQLNRSTGQRASRGTVGVNSSSVGGAILLRYWLYVGTAIATAAGFALGARRAFLVFRRGANWNGLAVPFSLAIGSTITILLISIRFPHYSILVLVPMLMYVAGEAGVAWERRPHLRRALTAGLAALMVLTLAGGIGRMAWPSDSNTMLDASHWLDKHARPGDAVVTEEPIGMLVNFQHCRVAWAEKCNANWEWIITYTSATQELSKNTALQRMLSESKDCITFTGFKEHVTVYARNWKPTSKLRSC